MFFERESLGFSLVSFETHSENSECVSNEVKKYSGKFWMCKNPQKRFEDNEKGAVHGVAPLLCLLN